MIRFFLLTTLSLLFLPPPPSLVDQPQPRADSIDHVIKRTMTLTGRGNPHTRNSLPVIKARGNQATVRDGEHVKIDSWILEPNVKPDIYYLNVPRKNSRVSFITDQDSIHFYTQYGWVYDFVVLQGKDSAYIRISANYPDLIKPTRLGQRGGPVTIPFQIWGSRIYVKGTVNGHADIPIQFDLGAGGCVVNKNSVAKMGINFDGTTMLTNTQGTHTAPTSAHNTLVLGELTWSPISVVQAENMKDDEDLIIGNSLFGDKILAIDYDKQLLTVHDRLPAIASGYRSQPVIYYQHRPRIQASLTIGGKRYTDWFTFDTGWDGPMDLRDDFTSRPAVWDQLQTVFSLGSKKIVRLPTVEVGVLTFRDVVTNAADSDKPTGRQSLLGNELLNHFNVILDNQQGIIYLKPNSLQGKAYSDWRDFRLKVAGLLGGVLLVVGVGVVVLVRKGLNRKKQG